MNGKRTAPRDWPLGLVDTVVVAMLLAAIAMTLVATSVTWLRMVG